MLHRGFGLPLCRDPVLSRGGRKGLDDCGIRPAMLFLWRRGLRLGLRREMVRRRRAGKARRHTPPWLQHGLLLRWGSRQRRSRARRRSIMRLRSLLLLLLLPLPLLVGLLLLLLLPPRSVRFLLLGNPPRVLRLRGAAVSRGR